MTKENQDFNDSSMNLILDNYGDYSTSIFDDDFEQYDIEYYECDSDIIEELTPSDIKQSILVDCSKQGILDIILLPFAINISKWLQLIELTEFELDWYEKEADIWDYLSGSIIKTPIGYGYRKSQYPD
jgi:hypothetical protein